MANRCLILFPDGQEQPLPLDRPDDANAVLDACGDSALAAYVRAEELPAADRPAPPSLAAMRRLELADYEPASDAGNLRLYPKGKLIFDLLADWAHEIAVNRLSAMPIDTPLLYDWADEQVRQQAGAFHERHYVVRPPDEPGREFVLRFAGDFGLFKIMRQARFSRRMLPLRVYEFSASFRYERSGALAGLKRLRAFHMPDVHSFCADQEQAWDEYGRLFAAYEQLAEGAGVEHAVCFRVVADFFEEHRSRIASLLADAGRPAFVELLPSMKHYWALKHELQAIDSVGGNVQLSTVQLDVKEADVYGIRYTDAGGAARGCTICHSSVGSIERWMYAVLEQALRRKQPLLPLWLAPAQVRLLPVSQRHLEHCLGLALPGVRLEVDDSEETLPRKVARAGRDWVPYVAVVGDEEVGAHGHAPLLSVSRRDDNSRRKLSPAQLVEEVQGAMAGKPFRPLPLPSRLSMQPRFFG